MKKAFLLGITLLATFSLTGCEMIENLLKGGQDLIDEKKDYKYDDFAVLIAGTEFKFDFTKCTAETDLAGEKSTIEYTYNAEDKLWHYDNNGADGKKESSVSGVSENKRRCPGTPDRKNEYRILLRGGPESFTGAPEAGKTALRIRSQTSVFPVPGSGLFSFS